MDSDKSPVNAGRLHRLIDDLCDASISSDDLRELNEQLESDASSRSEYLNHICVEATLCSLFLKTDRPERARSVSAGATTPGWKLRQFLALAATVAAVAAGSSWVTQELQRGAADDVIVLDVERGPAVARISGTRNCLWAGDNVAIGYGSSLIAGELLQLKTGLVEITFDDGARIVLEGPSSLRVPDANSAQLLTGRMSAAVPPGKRDFCVSTPQLSVRDAGVQFGVFASESGLSEVHVFEGSVHAELTNERGQTVRQVELSDRNAARLDPQSADVTFISVNEGSFVRTLAASTGPAGGLLAVEEFDYPVGPLAWQNGGFGWAGPWADIEVDAPAGQTGAAESNGVAMGSLTYRGGLALGNRVSQTGQANRIRRALSTSIGGVFDSAELVENQDGVRLIGRDGHSVYLSFLQRVSKTDDVFYGVELHRGDGNFNRVLCVGNGAEKSGYGVTSNYNAYVGEKCAQLGQENTDANFFVVRIEFGEEHKDVVTVFRNPSSLDDESQCQPSAELRGNFAFDRISVANFEGEKVHEVDEIRVGSSFRAVTVERGQLEVPLAALIRPDGIRLSALRSQTVETTGPRICMLLGEVLSR